MICKLELRPTAYVFQAKILAGFAMAPPCTTVGAAVSALSLIAVLSYVIVSNNRNRSKSSSGRASINRPRSGLVAAIGNTPLIRINSLSDATGCEVIIRFHLLLIVFILFCFILYGLFCIYEFALAGRFWGKLSS